LTYSVLQEEKQILEDIYSPLKEKLNKESIGEKNQIDFFARIELNVNEFFGKADKVVDFSRGGTYCRKGDLLFKEIKSLAEKIEIGGESDVYSLITQLYKTFEESDGKSVEISNQLLEGKKHLDFYKWIFNVSDFKVNYSIKYQGTNIELLSPGKKGIVLLLMYLALDTESSIPLIIDQPEENLDNKSLYPHLVDYFKIAKKRRQIIIVTHNPNLVLNTDAEQIIVANFEAVPNTYKARITYISGAIENSYINKQLNIPLLQQGIREHGADILEGGKVAFVRRKDRYEY
jgi:predicted ATP-dependent endonuclease of OLD family